MRSYLNAELIAEGEVADWLRSRVRKRTPSSIIRFGDAESRLLVAQPDTEWMHAAIEKLRRDTGRCFSQQEALQIKASLRFAFDHADLLGILARDAFGNRYREWMHRLAALHSERLSEGRPPAPLASNLLSHHIFKELPEILDGRPTSVISCRNLKPPMEDAWGISDVAVYQVPSQYRERHVDGAYEATMYGISIWPDVHAQIRSELTVRERGEVFLVGAGVFGKDLCVDIRSRGGIGLDMGSALDRLAGKVTRGIGRGAFDLLAIGVPGSEIAANFRDRYGIQIDDAEIYETIMDTVRDDLGRWRERHLEAIYATIQLDTLPVAIGDDLRNCHIALGITRNGNCEGLGMWWQEDGDDESSQWSTVLRDLRERGVRNLSVACNPDSRLSLARATADVFPGAIVRTAAEPIDSTAAVREAVARHGRFPDQETAATLVYLALDRATSS